MTEHTRDHALSGVLAAASEARAFLEPLWAEWKEERAPWMLRQDRPLSHSMCRFSALFLARVLEEAVGGRWYVDGGAGDHHDDVDPYEVDPAAAPGGIRAGDGGWNGHYWAVCEEGDVLADVTADQFGWPSVVVTRAPDPRYRGNYRPAAVDGHLAAVSARVESWLALWSARAPRPGPR